MQPRRAGACRPRRWSDRLCAALFSSAGAASRASGKFLRWPLTKPPRQAGSSVSPGTPAACRLAGMAKSASAVSSRGDEPERACSGGRSPPRRLWPLRTAHRPRRALARRTLRKRRRRPQEACRSGRRRAAVLPAFPGVFPRGRFPRAPGWVRRRRCRSASLRPAARPQESQNLGMGGDSFPKLDS